MITIKNYTERELEYIKNNYNILTIKEISKVLNKTENSISNAARKLGLKKQIHKEWTKEENDFLIKNYESMTNTEMAKILKRTFNSVSGQMDRLNLVRSNPWTDNEEKFLNENFMIMTHKEMGDILGRTEGAIRSKCFDLKLYKKEIPWSDYELDFLKRNYKEMSNVEISKILNRTESAIRLQASKMGMKKYPYFCNYHYFENIDTEEKAYWLGFLTADGWINKNDKTNAGVVGIELQYNDIEHLRKFNKSIDGNYKITDRWRNCKLSKNKDKKNHMCIIRIFSLTMYETLKKIGFDNDKSYDFNIPKLRPELIRHYIRGYFDGDGCFTVTDKSFSVSFVTASKSLNNDIINILKNENIYISESSYINEFGTEIFRPSICRKQDKIKFLNYIYQNCNIYLDRKYNKYLKLKKYITESCLAI